MSLVEEIRSLEGISNPQLAGEGGFGLVFRAWQESLGREIAVKVARATVMSDAARQRFEDECRAAGALSTHPNVATVHSSGFTGSGRPYLVMEYSPGGSLADHLAAHGSLSWEDALGVGRQVGEALESAHVSGLLHRDLKPENILVSRFGQPMLADFGLAQVGDSVPTSDGGGMVASLAHTAPELLADGAGATIATDVYALASTVFTLLHGSAPFWREGEPTVFPLVARIATSDVPDLRPAGVPSAFCDLLERSLSRDPVQRPATAGDFAAECVRIGEDFGVDPGRPLPPRAGDPAATVARAYERPLPPRAGDPAATVARAYERPLPVGDLKERAQRRVPVIAVAVGLALLVVAFAMVLLRPSGEVEPTGAGEPTADATRTRNTVATTTTVPESQDPPTSSEALDGTAVVRPPASGEADSFPRIAEGSEPAGLLVGDPITGEPIETALEPAAPDEPALEIGNDLTCRNDAGTAPGVCALARGSAGWVAIAVWTLVAGDDDCLLAFGSDPSCPEVTLYAQDGHGGRFAPVARTDFANSNLGDIYDITVVPFTSGGEQAIAVHYAAGGATVLFGYLEVVTWAGGADPAVTAHATAETNGGLPRAHSDGILLIDVRDREVLDLYRTDEGDWMSVVL